MIDQYIYSRQSGSVRAADSGKLGTGYGFVFRTDGVTGAVMRGAAAISGYGNEANGSDGQRLPVLAKRRLPGCPGMMAIAQSVQLSVQPRLIPLTHGYLFSAQDASGAGHDPDRWMCLPFVRSEAEQVGALKRLEQLPGQVQPLMPLKQVLERAQLTLEHFVLVVKACFDGKNAGELVLLELDYGRAEAAETAAQLIRWIYHFLPWAMRREADFTTCFDDSCSSDYTLALIPSVMVEERDDHLVVATRRGYFIGEGYLFARGTVVHAPSKRHGEFASTQTVYGQWLERVIRRAAACTPEEQTRLLTHLEKRYARFDGRISRLPEDRRCRESYYSALLWNDLRGANGMGVGEEQGCRLLGRLLDFGSGPETEDAVGWMLGRLEERCRIPASAQVIRLLTRVLNLELEEKTLFRTRELICAMLAADMERAESGESSAVSARYLRLMGEAGGSRELGLSLLECVFFPLEFETQESGGTDIWKRFGTSRSLEEGNRRVSDWVSGYANVCTTDVELLNCGSTVMRELKGFDAELLSRVLDALLGAEEIRFHFSRFEISPALLLDCCRRIERARGGEKTPLARVAERYYTQLLRQLCRNYIEYLEDRCTLDTILELNQAFRSVGEDETAGDYLRELTVSQVRALCGYDWERLKGLLSKSDRNLMEKLWQVLDLLDGLRVRRELSGELCGQICRYVLHGAPRYADDRWIAKQVVERPDVEPTGYYLELLTLRDFFQGEEQTLERLQACVKARHLRTNPMKDVMKFLYRMFKQGSMPRLDLMLVQGIYLVNSAHIKADQLEVFRAVCAARGGSALVKMLNQWPSAPWTEGDKRGRGGQDTRRGAYPWLKTDGKLLQALLRLSRERMLMAQLQSADETFYPGLMDAVDALVPVGAVGRPIAVEINKNLSGLWNEKASVMKKMLRSSRMRRLLVE